MNFSKNGMIFLCLIISLVSLAFYIRSFYIHPADEVPFIGSDEVIWIDSSKAVLWGFQNPFFMNKGSIFHDPFPGSPYVMSAIGILFYATSIDPSIILIALKFIFLFLFLVVAYRITGHFFRSSTQKNSSFLLYLTMGGIGGLLYVILLAANGNVTSAYQGVLLFTGITKPDSAIYHVASLFFGYSSIYFMLKKKSWIISGALLGLAALIYPIFGIAFFLAAIVYGIINREPGCIKMVIVGAIFASPWAISYLQYSDIIRSLSAQRNYINIPVLFIQGIFLITFGAIYLLKYHKFGKDRSWDFILIFTIIVILIAIVPPIEINPLTNTQRMIWVLFLPLSIVGTKGIFEVFKTRANKIAAIIIILSSFTVIIGNAYAVAAPAYSISEIEYNALVFLKGQQFGNVLTNDRLSDFVPYVSEKRSHSRLFYSNNPFFSETDSAYKTSDSAAFAGILKKYDIKYVISENDGFLSSLVPPDASVIYDKGGIKIFMISPKY